MSRLPPRQSSQRPCENTEIVQYSKGLWAVNQLATTNANASSETPRPTTCFGRYLRRQKKLSDIDTNRIRRRLLSTYNIYEAYAEELGGTDDDHDGEAEQRGEEGARAELKDWLKNKGDVSGMDEGKHQVLTRQMFRKSFRQQRFGKHFYSLCMGDWHEDTAIWHCPRCKDCVEWREWHCRTCNKCTYDFSITWSGCGGGISDTAETMARVEDMGAWD